MTLSEQRVDLPTWLGSLLHGDRDRNAIQYEGEWYSWGRLADIVDGVARELGEAGVPPSATVGLVLRERPWTIGAFYGLLSLRAAVLLMAPLQPDVVLREDIESLGLWALVADERDWERAGFVDAARTAGTLGIALTRDPDSPVRLVPGLELAGPGDHFDLPTDTAVTLLTSGTTGPPKRIPVTYAELEQRLANRKKSAGVTINALPLTTVGGVFGLLSSAVRDRPLSVMDRFDVRKWAELIREHQPRRMGAPPAVLRMILDADIPPEYFSSVRVYSTASAPLDITVAAEFTAKYGIDVIQGYGATEFHGSVVGWTDADREWFARTKIGSVGRPLEGVELRIVDPESRAVLPVATVGRLEVWQRDRSPDTPEWQSTNDLARVDEDGFLWIIGRADDVIIRGGFKVHPSEVEDALKTHPAVKDAAVVGLPDQRLTEVPVAIVIPYTSCPAATEQELIDWVKQRVAPYKVPVQIVPAESIPLNSMLKVDRQSIRARFVARDTDTR